MSDEAQKVDGNAAGGLLQQIFVAEMTSAWVVCAGCGSAAVMAETAVFATAMGTVIRCPSCDHVLIKIANLADGPMLDFQGMRLLQIPT